MSIVSIVSYVPEYGVRFDARRAWYALHANDEDRQAIKSAAGEEIDV